MIGSRRGCPIGSLSGPRPSGHPPPRSRPPSLSLRAPSSPGAPRPRLPGDAQVALAESLRPACARSAPRSQDAPGGERAPARGRRVPGRLWAGGPPQGAKGRGRGSPQLQKPSLRAHRFPSSIQTFSYLLPWKSAGLLSAGGGGEQMYGLHRAPGQDGGNFLFGKDTQSAERSRRAHRQ